MSLEDIVSEIGKEVKRQNFSENELKHVLKYLKGCNPRKYTPLKFKGNGKEMCFGIISDLHVGHQNYRGDILTYAAKDFKKEGIEFIINTGDSLEGMSGRDGHIYELSHIGFSNQLNALEDEFKKLKDYTVYSIEANDSHTGWFNSKANMGIDAGEEIQKRISNYKFLGWDEQDLVVDNIRIRLRHPGGGTAYANSYKMQKYVESLSGGNKPNIVIEGHFHKALYQYIRGIHCIDAGCLQDQSPFMKKKGTPAHTGYWKVKMKYDKNGIREFTPTFVPFYD